MGEPKILGGGGGLMNPNDAMYKLHKVICECKRENRSKMIKTTTAVIILKLKY